ncbi:TVP38/TMEM64 family protein [Aneurinibacillus sp. Ricciae_BoGa-3]|uniref:TVP38/TMEM64 family protein n=1 Tax=Aneurinibacillus sp. Ricciae_BoGa-3 TaxID=3022697 RepID=UPI00234258A8|nr:TVP38/TMEM64 family protein [Aneurinibacillus sp. Ricciae_BoGa-3]WCK52955.1 TVP38/TMEM64 family protein [Aneurinibacillus sp. Ricciae_BoGa-3]
MKQKILTPKLMLLLVVVGLLLWINHTYIHATPQSIRDWILSFGWIAPLLYILLYTVRPLLLFPASILSLSGGLAFGTLFGTVYTVIGATLGAALSFLVARYLGKDLVRKQWTGNWGKLETKLAEQGFLYVFLLRLIPLFPFDLISYISGISKVHFRAFVYGTLFGIIPATFAYNFFGASLTKGTVKDIILAILMFLAALIIPLLFKKKFDPSKK